MNLLNEIKDVLLGLETPTSSHKENTKALGVLIEENIITDKRGDGLSYDLLVSNAISEMVHDGSLGDAINLLPFKNIYGSYVDDKNNKKFTVLYSTPTPKTNEERKRYNENIIDLSKGYN